MPDARDARKHERCQQRVQREAHEVGRDHHAVARKAVRPHSADQEERRQREALRGEHDPEVGGVAGALDHVQRERHQRDEVAYHAE